MKRLDGSLSSLAKGRYYRAYFDPDNVPAIGEIVTVVDTIAEDEETGVVVEFSGPFVYVDQRECDINPHD